MNNGDIYRCSVLTKSNMFLLILSYRIEKKSSDFLSRLSTACGIVCLFYSVKDANDAGNDRNNKQKVSVVNLGQLL